MSRRCGVRSRSAGISLIEVLLSGTLAVVVLSILLGLIVPSMRFLYRGSRQSALGQEAVVLSDRLERDVAACSFPTVTYLPRQNNDPPDQPGWLLAGRLKTAGPSREQVWDEAYSVVYRFRPGRQSDGLPIVTRIADVQVASSVRKRPPLNEIVDAFTAGISTQGEADLAPHLTDLEWNSVPGASLFELHLKFERDDLSGPPLVLETHVCLRPRNELRTGTVPLSATSSDSL